MPSNNWWSQPRLNRVQRRATEAAARKSVRPELTQLEDRTTPVNITTAAGGVLTLDIDNANEVVTFNAGGGGSLSVNSTNTIFVDTVASGTSVTFFGTTSVTTDDSGSGTGVTFNNSGVNPYSAAFTVTLDNAPGEVQFNGSSAFGANNLNVTTARNIAVNAAATVTATSGNITLSANQQGTPTSGNFIGIQALGSVTSGTGSVSLVGKGGDDAGGTQTGVRLAGGASVGTTGAGGTVSVTGQGGITAGDTNFGVVVENASSQITSGGGSVTVIGTGGGTGVSFGNDAVKVASGGRITAGGTGTVNVTGQGGVASAISSLGVFVVDANSQITSSGGDVTVNGTGGGTVNNNTGVRVQDGGQVTAGGTGAVSVTGQGGANGTGVDNYGVWVFGTNSRITSTGGAVTVNGTGGGTGGASNNNNGVRVESAGQITAGGTGTVSVTGTGGASGGTDNFGVNVLTGSARITSNGGAVSVTGVAGSGTNNIGTILGSGGGITSAANAAVTVTSDSATISAGSTVSAGTGTVTIRTRTAGTKIDLGGADVLSGSPLTLGLTDAELDLVTAGTLVVGQSTTGDIDVTADISRGASTAMELVSGDNINVSGGQVNTGGGTLLLTPGTLAAEGVAPTKSATDATASTLSFTSGSNLKVAVTGTTVDTQYTQLNVSGGVNLTGLNLSLSGAYTPSPLDVFTIVSATSVTGTFNGLADGATVTLNGQNLRINYTATAVTLTAIATLTVSVDGGGNLVLTDVSPGGSDDDLTITKSGTDFVITSATQEFGNTIAGGTLSNGNKTITLTAAAFSGSIILNTQAGSDTASVDYSGGRIGRTVLFNGGGGTSDTLNLVRGTSTGVFTDITHTFANANDGSVTLTDGVNTDNVVYSGLEPITDNLDAVNRTFQFSGAADAVVLQTSGASGFDLNIDSNAAEAVDFVSPTGSLTILAGAGDDTVTLTSVTNFTAALVADGQGDTDSISQNAALAVGSGAVTGNVSLTAETVDVNGTIDTTGGATDGNVNLTGGTITVDAAVTAGGGNVSVAATGTATQTAAMTGTGLVLGAGGNAGTYTLTDSGNNFATLNATTTAAVSYRDSDALDLAGVNVGGNVGLTVGGALTDSAASVVGGTFSLTAGTNSATLDEAANDFATVQVVSAANVTLVDANGVIFATSNLTGTLQVNAGGAITQTGEINAAAVNVTGTSVTLTSAANTVGTVGGSATGGAFDFTNDAALAVNAVSATADATLTTTAGAMTLNGNVAAGAGNAVTLNAAGGGTQAGGTAITGGNLLLLSSAAGGSFTLTDTGNNVGTLAANLSGAGSNLQYTDANVLTVGTVGSTNGVTTNGGAITVATVNGNLTVTQPVSTTAASRQAVLLTAGGANSTFANSGSVLGGPVTVTADRMALAALVDSAGFLATLVPFSANRLIDLGSITNAAANTLELSAVEMSNVAASELRVGDATTGNITVSASVAPAGTSVLSLVTGAGVVNGGGSVAETDLRITAVSGIGDGNPLNIDAGVLTFTNGTSGTAEFAEANTTAVSTSSNATRGVTFAGGRFNIALGQTLTTSLLTVTSGALGGTGTVVGPVRNLASTAPGFSPGILNTGSYTFASGGLFQIEVGGTTPGNTATSHDQLNVTGTVDIEVSVTLTLTLFGGFTPVAGQRYVIVNNDGTDTVTGAFAGLGEGAGFSLGGVPFIITYRGGDGNDVVLVANQTPTASFTTAPGTGNEGSLVTFVGSVADADGNQDAPFTYTYSVTASNGQGVAGSSGSVPTLGNLPAYSFTPNDDGTYTVTLTVADRFGFTSSTTTTLTVANVDPGYTAPSDQTGTEGSAGTFTLGTFTDPAGANDGAYEVTVDWGDGNTDTFTVATPGSLGNRTHTYADDGSYTVTVTVAEAGGSPSGSGTFTVAVSNVAPTVTINGPGSGLEATALNFTSTVTDPGSPEVFTYAWSVTKDGAAFGPSGSAATFSFTPDDNANYEVTLTVSDGDGGSTTATKTVVVSNVIPSAVALTPSTAAPNEGQAVTLSGTFADPGTLDTHTVVIDWGDGDTTTVTLAAGVLTFPAQSHTYADDGTFTAVVTVTDKDGGQATGTQTFSVANVDPAYTAPADQPADEGASTAFALGSFTDPAGALDGDYEVTVDWGDGNTDTFTVATPGSLGNRTHTYADDGSYTVTVTVAEAGGTPTATGTFLVTVANVAPAYTAPADQTGNEGASTAFALGSFTDPAGGLDGPYTVTVDWGDGSADDIYTVTTPGALNPRPHTYADDGTYTVTVDVAELGGTPAATGTFTVNVANVAPTVAINGPGSGVEGTALNYTSTATDPAGANDPLTYAWSVTKDGAAFGTPGTAATFSFTPDDNATYELTLTVTDGDGGSTTATKTVVVSNVAPTLTPPADQTTDEGVFTAFALGSFTDPAGTFDADYVVTLTWGDGDTETFTVAAPGSLGTGTHTYADNGTYTVTVAVTDDDGATRQTTFTVTVNNVAPANVTPGGPYTVTEGGTVTLTGSATDVPADTLTYEWDLDGDGIYGETGGAAARGGELGQTVTYNAAGLDGPSTHAVSLQVRDEDGGLSAPVSTTVGVTNVAPSITDLQVTSTIGENGTVTLTGTYSDPGTPDTHMLTVNWGDGNSETFTVSGGTFSRTHQYLDDTPTGTAGDVYIVTATLADDDGGVSAPRTDTVLVNNFAPRIGVVSVTPQVNENGTVTLTGTYTDVGTLDTHSVMVIWGDGTTETFAVSGGTFTRTHQYLDDGVSGDPAFTYVINVTLTDDDGGRDQVLTQTQVDNVAPTITAASVTASTESGVATLTGTYSDPGTLDTHTLTVNWGDGTVETLAVSGGAFSFTHTYADDTPTGTPTDSYTVSLTLTDDDTGTTSASRAAVVNNAAPVLGPLVVTPAAVNEGQAVSVTGTYSDAGTLDTHTLTVNWGDGTVETFTVTGGPFTFTHTYADDPAGSPDQYTITVTVTDDDTGTATATAVASVANVAPTASASGPTTGFAERAMTFTATATDPAGANDPLAFAWTVLKNGSPFATGSGPSFTFTPAAGGTYSVSVGVTDGDGGSATVVLPPVAVAPATILAVAVGSRVQLINQVTGVVRELVPFPGFLGTLSTAVADLNGDGVMDVVIGAGAGGGPHVRAFDGVNLAEVASFFAYDVAFTGGVNVAAAEGRIITGAGAGGGPHVKVFDATGTTEVASFFAFDAAFTGGVRVAARDIAADGVIDLVAAAGPGGGPHVKAFALPSLLLTSSFYAANQFDPTGVFVG